MFNVEVLRRRFQKLLIEDVILRQQENPQEPLMYTVEVSSDGSRNPEDVKKDMVADTGMVPAIYDQGTHYVVNHKITLETLGRIQKYTDVEIKGEYSGSTASRGAAHERGERDYG
jgi:hypothetical protein